MARRGYLLSSHRRRGSLATCPFFVEYSANQPSSEATRPMWSAAQGLIWERTVDRAQAGCEPYPMNGTTQAAVAQTNLSDPAKAGASLAEDLTKGLAGERPDALILFASPSYDYGPLLRALDEGCHPAVLVGSSSAGEFTSAVHGEGFACAVALRARDMLFTAAVGRSLSVDPDAAAVALVAGLTGKSSPGYAYRTALVLTDALAGRADELVARIVGMTGGGYRIFGGGAGGDAKFQRRFVFCGTEVIADGVVALEMLSNKPIGIGVRHGWRPSAERLRVTEASGTRLGSLNAVPAAEVFEEHAEKSGQAFDRGEPLPFFLHNVIGVETAHGRTLRVPLEVNADGSVACAAEVPEGVNVCLMNVTLDDAVAAAAASTKDAVVQLGGRKPAVALFFDCVASRLRMGDDFAFELAAVQRELGEAKFAGCNSIGQIANAEGQFSGFHNCTAVVCVIPE